MLQNVIKSLQEFNIPVYSFVLPSDAPVESILVKPAGHGIKQSFTDNTDIESNTYAVYFFSGSSALFDKALHKAIKNLVVPEAIHTRLLSVSDQMDYETKTIHRIFNINVLHKL